MKKKYITQQLLLLLLSFVMSNDVLAKKRSRSKKKSLSTPQPMLLAQNEISDSDNFLYTSDNEPLFLQEEPDKPEINYAGSREQEIEPLAITPPENSYVDDVQDLFEQDEDEESDTVEEEFVDLNFENADLSNLIKQIEAIFGITFLTDDMIDPLAQGSKAIKGNKISFKTQNPLTRQETWNLFITFLQIAGFTAIQHNTADTYRIIALDTARKSPLPVFIGTNFEELPDSDEVVRYVYFVENSTVDAIKNFIDSIRSSASSFVILQEHKAFILTDKAHNIKLMMNIIREIDKESMPEVASVLELKQVDAKQVKDLYESLIQSDDKLSVGIGPRKQPTTKYFSEGTQIIAYGPRNILILLGKKNTIEEIESFIKKYIDVEATLPYPPYFVHQLRYADASTIAEIMSNITEFGKNTEAGKSGGVRGQDQYLKPMSFIPEKESNRIIIKGDYEDYLKAKEIIEKLDDRQPQVGIEVLIVTVRLDKRKSLGTQLRSKSPGGVDGLIGDNVKFQTSGLFGSGTIQENKNTTKGTDRLLGNLLNLVSGASPGNSIIALGKDLFGVWGVFQALETITNAQVVSNPFLIATNKVPATVSLGEERRVRTATIVGGGENNVDSFGKDSAAIEVKIIPQINSDGMILLDIKITFNDFTDSTNLNSATKNVREIKTSAVVADQEVLALGGLIRNRIISDQSKTPVLGDVPILGWLFKNKQKSDEKQSLLILISSHIIEPHSEKDVQSFTNTHINDYEGTLSEMAEASERHDPIHKIFFDPQEGGTEKIMEDFLFDRKRRSRRKQKNKKNKNRSPESDTKMMNAIENQPRKTTSQVAVRKKSEKDNVQMVSNDTPLLEKMRNKKQPQLSLSHLISEQEGETKI